MMLLALLWGFAEATLFFIVPDVLVSVVAVRSGVRRALGAAALAAIGAAAGGAAMYAVAADAPARVAAALDAVPAISAAMVAEARADLAANGYGGMLRAAYSGVPFKLYAAAAGEAGRSLPGFLAAALGVRASRFVLVALAAAAASAALGRVPLRVRLGLLAAGWAVFYAAYFATVG